MNRPQVRNRERVYDGYAKVDTLDAGQGTREVVQVSDSVGLLIYLKDQRKVLLVRQQREPVLVADEEGDGRITELLAGRFDCDLGVKGLAVKEAWEEAGAQISEDDVELMNDGKPMYVSAGIVTERSYLAYVEISDDQIEQEEREFGCADEGESIERVWMHEVEFTNYRPECCRVFAMQQWFLRRKDIERIQNFVNP